MDTVSENGAHSQKRNKIARNAIESSKQLCEMDLATYKGYMSSTMKKDDLKTALINLGVKCSSQLRKGELRGKLND